eukprot:841436-Pyramimonas_sp.AAC.1
MIYAKLYITVGATVRQTWHREPICANITRHTAVKGHTMTNDERYGFLFVDQRMHSLLLSMVDRNLHGEGGTRNAADDN